MVPFFCLVTYYVLRTQISRVTDSLSIIHSIEKMMEENATVIQSDIERSQQTSLLTNDIEKVPLEDFN